MQPDSLHGDEDMDEGGGPSRVWMALLFIALIAVASAALYQWWTLQGEPRWAAVRFDARLSGDELLLSWDPNAPEVAGAERGALLVNDGSHPVSISLPPEQLRSGSLPYSPSSANVLFRLRLYGKGKSFATDSLRVITRDNTVDSKHPDSPATETKAAPPPAGPAAGSPVVRREVQPANPPDIPATETKATPPPASRAASAPVVRREVQPVIPPGIRRRIASPVLVHVVVTIDETGHVTQASPSVTGSGLQRYLSDEAVRAAREWLFSPARSQNGKPIGATKSLTFEFLPEQK
jgi:TonB family protein